MCLPPDEVHQALYGKPKPDCGEAIHGKFYSAAGLVKKNCEQATEHQQEHTHTATKKPGLTLAGKIHILYFINNCLQLTFRCAFVAQLSIYFSGAETLL